MKNQLNNTQSDLEQEIIKLVKENPNNFDLGAKVRLLVNSLEK
jgi:hypothetical protein